MVVRFAGNHGYVAETDFHINVLLGKNGCGKSVALKSLDQRLHSEDGCGTVRYITPERGGNLQYHSTVDHTLVSNVSWLDQSRRVNQFEQFREQSFAQFRKLEILALREIEKDTYLRQKVGYTFDEEVKRINSLLDNVEILRTDIGFKLQDRYSGEDIAPNLISSGEAESITLAIECLMFFRELQAKKQNVLLFDEPDVHLHPDLQAKLMKFICELVAESEFYVFIATHSTAIVGALDNYGDIGVNFMEHRSKSMVFRPVKEVHRRVLPVFGAHPLSSLFNRSPILLVEGEDDVRIWQQAVRTSHGKLMVHPCAVGSIEKLSEWEDEVVALVDSVYDDAKAFSLRDRDQLGVLGVLGVQNELDDKGLLIRFQLHCRAAENLILSDEVLGFLGVNWNSMTFRINDWISNNSQHVHFDEMCRFRDFEYDRFNFDLKKIRNDLMGIIGSSKPWEVAVGQVIGNMKLSGVDKYPGVSRCLGPKIIENLFQ